MKTVAKYYCRLMKVKGVEIIYGLAPDSVERNPAEELFDRFIKPYRPYISDKRKFDRTNTDRLIKNLRPPEFTYEIFKICMEYAVKVNWGTNFFNEEN
jgi:hypothetical protein